MRDILAFIYEFLEEATWDNGQPVLGNDYVFTVKMIKNPYVAAPAYRGTDTVHQSCGSRP